MTDQRQRRASITLDDVKKAFFKLQDESNGHIPSIRAIQREIGGSLESLSKFHKQILEELSQEKTASQENLLNDKIKAQLENQFYTMVNTMYQNVSQEFKERLGNMASVLTEKQTIIDTQAKELDSLDTLKADLLKSEEEVKKAEEEVQRLNNIVKTQDKQLIDLNRELNIANSNINQMQANINSIQSELNKKEIEIERLKLELEKANIKLKESKAAKSHKKKVQSDDILADFENQE